MSNQPENIRKWLLFSGILFLMVFVVVVITVEPISISNPDKVDPAPNMLRKIAQDATEPPIETPAIETETTVPPINIDIKMAHVEGGTFMMGWAEEESRSFSYIERSKPVHQVTVNSFYIGKYEITQAQWEAVMGTTLKQQRDKAKAPSGFNAIRGEGGNYPMYFVSWNETQEFIRRLNAGTGKKYRLPTEAEWEYAARGGNKSQGYRYSGSNNLDDVAWYKDNSGGTSHPVGTKQPNELGIYDMSGNVRELCYDWYQDGYHPSSTPHRDSGGPSSGSQKVHRSGSWWNIEVNSRVPFRFGIEPNNGQMLQGFRVAQSL